MLATDERTRQIHGAAWAHSFGQTTYEPNVLKFHSVTLTAARRPAFTRIELVIIIAVLGVLVALLPPAMSQASRKAKRIRCISHLKQIGLSFKIFANDHADRYPMQVWPNDSRPSFIFGLISYFVGLNSADEYPQSFLAGDRNLRTNGILVGPGLLAVTTNTVLGWSENMHKNCGNLSLGDGSVQPTTESNLKEFTRHQGIGTNWLAIP